MSIRDLFFIRSEEEENKKDDGVTKKKDEVTTKNKFPTFSSNEPQKNETTTNFNFDKKDVDNASCNQHIDNIMKMYEDGFKGLNMDGYDFFEYLQMVAGVGIDNSMAYVMAFTMGKTMGATKESLLSQSQYYVDEINKVYNHYVESGVSKKEATIKMKNDEALSLNAELSSINSEIARLNSLKSEKESMLLSIDEKYSPQISEIECKLKANDMAKEKIIGTINTVVNGIKSNI